MNIRTIILGALIFMFVQSIGFGFSYKEPIFPYKAFVWQGARIPASDLQNVTITKETPYVIEFTYQGKKYKATLFVYGAIYLERPDSLPLLISFDIKEYKLDAKFMFIHEYD
ncbi:MAG: hypothetical protein ABSG94_05410 [Brevinematales bacterium]|jgi:hypothetical protein